MTDARFTLEQFREAHARIRPYVQPTFIKRSKWLSDELEAEVFLKMECLHEGNSFKIRGATNALLAQPSPPLKVVTASGGNHGLAVAIASHRLSIPCVIVLPTNTPPHRCKVIESYGAQVILHGSVFNEANAFGMKMAEEEENTLYVHPFADSEVVLGQGTIALEIMEQLPPVSGSATTPRVPDALVASVGGGGLVAGISQCFRAAGNTHTKVYAVETEGADFFGKSWSEGQLVTLKEITSIAKTLGASTTTPLIYDMLTRNVHQCFTISDKDAVEAIYAFLHHEKILLEPACSCVVSSCLKNKLEFKGKTVVLVICGANTTLEEVEGWKAQFGIIR